MRKSSLNREPAIIDLSPEARIRARLGTPQTRVFGVKSYASDTEIQFADVADIVFLYLFLHPNISEIGQISCPNFIKIFEIAIRDWAQQYKRFRKLNYAWEKGRKEPAAFKYIEAVHLYEYLNLIDFLKGSGWGTEKNNPELYKRLKAKWINEENYKYLDGTFELAEQLCKKIQHFK